MPEGLTFAIAATLSISAPLTGWIAFRRDRPPIAWFVFGALSGPLALVILLTAPPGRCPRCDATVRGWPASCASCGRRFGGGSVPAPDPRPSDIAAEPGHAAGRREVPPTVEATPLPPRGGRRRTPEPWVAVLPGDPWAAERIPDRVAPPPRDHVVTPFPRPTATQETSTPQPPGLWPRLVAQATADRPTSVPAGSPGHDDAMDQDGPADGGLHMIASGIFTGGSARLEIGLRYGIGRDGPNMVILGPVDRTPNEVRAMVPIEGIDLLSIDDRITVARAGGHDRLAMAFISAAGLRGKDLEEALTDVAAGVGDPAGR